MNKEEEVRTCKFDHQENSSANRPLPYHAQSIQSYQLCCSFVDTQSPYLVRELDLAVLEHGCVGSGTEGSG